MIPTLARRLALAAATAMLLASPTLAADYDDKGEPLPWRGSTKDDGYPVPQPPPANYDHRSYKDDAPPPPRRQAAAECLSKYGIRSALNRQGWHEFDNVENRGATAFMTARNDGGRRFEVQFDNCTGEVIEAHPRVVYVERDPLPPPPVYYERYYAPRPAVGLYFYGGGHRHW